MRLPPCCLPARAGGVGLAAGFGQSRGGSCPASCAPDQHPGTGKLVPSWSWLCPRRPRADLPNTEVQNSLFSFKLLYLVRFQCIFLTWADFLSLAIVENLYLSQFKKIYISNEIVKGCPSCNIRSTSLAQYQWSKTYLQDRKKAPPPTLNH